jgi:hypothetical protein
MRGFLHNHQISYDGTGTRQLTNLEGHTDIPATPEGAVPYKMSQEKSDYWNLAMNGPNKMSESSRAHKSAEAFALARQNAGFTEGGYTNKLAKSIDLAHPPEPVMVDDPKTGKQVQKVDAKGKPVTQPWTEAKLNPGFETLRVDLTKKIHASGESGDEPIHSGHPAVAKGIQEEGKANTAQLKAGFMPGEGAKELSTEDQLKKNKHTIASIERKQEALDLDDPKNSDKWDALQSRIHSLESEAEKLKAAAPAKASYMPMAGPKAEGYEEAQSKGRTFLNPYDKLPRYEISDHDLTWKNPIRREGQTVPDVEGKKNIKLGELINHPELFEDYPEARNINVVYDRRTSGASFERGGDGTITLSRPASKNDLIHEIQHWIQARENLPGGYSYERASQDLDTASIRKQARADFNQRYKEDPHGYMKTFYPEVSPTRAVHDKEFVARVRNEYVNRQVEKAVRDEYWNKSGEIEAREAARRMEMTPEQRAAQPPYNPSGHYYIPLSAARYMPMAGPKAEGFEQAEREGRTFLNPYDNRPRYEISDHDMTWKNPDRDGSGPEMDPHDAYKLGDLINHPDLFQDYPDAKKINVEYDPKLGNGASFDAIDRQDKRATGLIKLGDPTRKDRLIHEIQHWVQQKEGFPSKGTSLAAAGSRLQPQLQNLVDAAGKLFDAKYPDGFEADRDEFIKKQLSSQQFAEYERNAGEIEAREAAGRHQMTPEEREATPPYDPSGKGYIEPQKAYYLPPAKATPKVRETYAETPERNKMVAAIQKKAQDWLDKNPVPELSSASAAASIPKDSQFTVEELADHLRKNYGKNMDLSKESHRAELARAVTHDIMVRLAEKGSGVGWYEVIPDAAIRYLADNLDHSILSTPENAFIYKAAMAIGSQGQSVYDNIETSYWAYKHWQEHGVLPTEKEDIVGGGKNINQIANNFAKVNRLVAKHGIEGTDKLFNDVKTVKEMEAAGLDIGQEDRNHPMQGSLTLGPKVGAFHAALNKHFEALVMDLWFNRTMNRMRGDMFAFEESPFRKQANTVKAQLESGEISLPDAQRSKILSEIDKLQATKKLTRQNIPKIAPTLLDWADKTHEAYRKTPTLNPDGTVNPKGPKTYGTQAKTEVNKNAKNLDSGLHLLQDLPRNIPERQQYRDIVNRSLKELSDAGIKMTVADSQSVMWYSEQALFDKGGALGAKSDTSDYLDAAFALVKQQREHPGMPTPESRAREKAELKASKEAQKVTIKAAKKAAKLGAPIPSIAD